MYPFVRMTFQLLRHRNDPPLPLLGTHISRHICWPWDLDFWAELNNGRTLTLYDMGRLPLASRNGLSKTVQANGWGMAVAGASIRFRRRVRAFDRITMKSRGVGWDSRFLYIEQSMWKSDGECASHALIRMAITGPKGIVNPADAARHMDEDPVSPPLPDWVAAWSDADAKRPWPPMAGA
ncbi:MAG: acyl-CoA thioesterase [Rhodobacterales bacterium]|nr:acyl-CoA thioesterase [Rhodobacterales bacterium]